MIFTTHQNLVMECGVHSLNFHHQITYAKLNLKIYYPPRNELEIWHYNQVKVDHVRKIYHRKSTVS